MKAGRNWLKGWKFSPSPTKTPLAAALTSSEQMATAIAGLHALQRLGEPDDIAAAAAFLLGVMGYVARILEGGLTALMPSERSRFLVVE